MVILPAINDTHLHLRQDNMTEIIAPYSAQVCDNVIIMPNTKPPIHDYESIKYYQHFYQKYLGDQCRAHLTAKLLPHTTTRHIEEAKRAGVLGFKLYPAGATTNSDDGIPEAWIIKPTDCFKDQIKAIRDNNLVLLCHGEMPSAFCMDREDAFLPFIDRVLNVMFDLRITLEHISTLNGIQTVLTAHREGCRILGTLTLQHMLFNHDALVGGKLRPELHCMPTLKRPPDQKTILSYALNASRYPCFAFGSDSAPHTDALNCGCFSAPVLLPVLHQIFENDFDAFCAFCIENGQRFYNLPNNKRTVKLEEKEWIVPKTINGITPFRAGETLKWRISV